MKTNNIAVVKASEIKKLGSAITIVGLELGPGGSEAFADWLHEKARFKAAVPDCYVVKGSAISREWPSTLNVVSFRLDAFENPGALVMARFEVGAKWLDDVVDSAGA